jgi:hypothetical protein
LLRAAAGAVTLDVAVMGKNRTENKCIFRRFFSCRGLQSSPASLEYAPLYTPRSGPDGVPLEHASLPTRLFNGKYIQIQAGQVISPALRLSSATMM